jgi:hypothetical protein
MDSIRKIAITVGSLYLIGDVFGALSGVFAAPMRNGVNFLLNVSSNQNQVTFGALLVLFMGLALAMIPILMYRILKSHDGTLALGYVVFRGALETSTYIATAISWLLLVMLSQQYVAAGASVATNLQALGTLLRGDEIGYVGTIIFLIGTLMFYYVLYKSKLVPRWLSGWGLVAIAPYMAAALLDMFAVIQAGSTVESVLYLPLALQEIALALWLITKGFNSSAVMSSSDKK